MKNLSSQCLILTFGYGNRSNYDSLLNYVKDYNIDFLVDVREKPKAWSRKWYGEQIKNFCQDHGVEYLSDKTLGNISGTNHWISPNPEKVDQVLEEIAEKIQNRTVLLLCAEKDHSRCHRVEVAEKLHKLTNQTINHLL